MASYLHPGVYVEEIPSGVKPIEGVATSVAAFIGSARRGPTNQPIRINSFDDYQRSFGPIADETDAMGLAVFAFYQNGGKAAYVARLVGAGAKSAFLELAGQGTGSTTILKISARSEGTWGNEVYLRIVKPSASDLTFGIEVGTIVDGAFTLAEKFDDLSMDETSSDYLLTRINGRSSRITVESRPETSAHYQNGSLTGSKLESTPNLFKANIKDGMALSLEIDGLGRKRVTLGTASGLALTTVNQADGDIIASAVQAAVRAISPGSAAYDGFTCTYTLGRFVLTSGTSSSSSSVKVFDGDRSATDLAALAMLDSRAERKISGGNLTGVPLPDTANFFTAGVQNSMTMRVRLDGVESPVALGAAVSLGLTGANASDGALVAAAIQAAVRTVAGAGTAYTLFECKYDTTTRTFALKSGNTASAATISVADGDGSATDLAFLLKLNPSVDRRAVHGSAKLVPQENLGVADKGTPLTAGSDGATPAAGSYSDFFALLKKTDANILILPGKSYPSDGPVIDSAISHCEDTRNRMVILDIASGSELGDPAAVGKLGLPTSTFCVLYYPWVQIANPFYNVDSNPNAEKTLLIAPSSLAAGMWAKIDGRRGVWKAPAGTETGLLGTTGLEFDIGDDEQDFLNPLGVNCFRKLQVAGLSSRVIWGTRTLATKADPEWRYVPVRRTAIFIEQSLYNGIQWAVFEPNDHRLWSSLRTNIDSFMNGLFRSGAFQGTKASDAYFVRCGLGDTMTQGEIDAGMVIVIVGFAPLKPAEFVIVRIQQKVGQQ